jgi:low affinity Fe/Cu permease
MRTFARVAHGITSFLGSGKAVIAIAMVVAGWLAWGFAGDFTRAWELTATAGAPVVTLFMLVVLQHAQNRESTATRLKLNELLLALEEPDTEVVTAEDKPDEELHALSREYRDRARSSS